jgi:hypothetical protein
VADVIPVHNTEFKVRSWPAAAAAPNGDLYATWTTEVKNTSPIYTGDTDCTYFIVGTPTVQANCHAVAVYSKSTNGGGTWSDPVPVFDAGSVTADGYPVTQPAPDPDPNGCQAANGCDGSTFNAPSPTGPIEDAFPAVSVSANGNVYLGRIAGTTFLRGRPASRVPRHQRILTACIWAHTSITRASTTLFGTLQRARRIPSARIPSTRATNSSAHLLATILT